MQMTAPVLVEPRRSMELMELDLDEPGFGEVRVKMVASGVCHSCLHAYDGSHSGMPMPMVPILLNTFFPLSQPSVERCDRFGVALAEAIATWPGSERVALVASGGLSHHLVDEDFDRRLLAALGAPTPDALAAFTDDDFVDGERPCGTGESKNWIVVAAARMRTDDAALLASAAVQAGRLAVLTVRHTVVFSRLADAAAKSAVSQPAAALDLLADAAVVRFYCGEDTQRHRIQDILRRLPENTSHPGLRTWVRAVSDPFDDRARLVSSYDSVRGHRETRGESGHAFEHAQGRVHGRPPPWDHRTRPRARRRRAGSLG